MKNLSKWTVTIGVILILMTFVLCVFGVLEWPWSIATDATVVCVYFLVLLWEGDL